ncbi:MAG: extracellular solute-binding protein, partial [Monoglobaceae bacterium]
AYDTLAKMKENGSLYPGAESLDNDMARALFAEGKIGMIFGGSFDVAVLTSQFPAKCDWSVAPLPIENKDEAYMQRMANDGGLVINKKTVEKIGDEKVLEIFKWFHSDEVLSELFKQGMAIPYDREIIDSVQPNEGIHEAWSKFGQMRKISTTYPREMPTDLEGTPSLSDIFKTNILPGNGNTVELLGDLSERSNNGIEKKFSVNSNLKREDYLKDEYDVRR